MKVDKIVVDRLVENLKRNRDNIFDIYTSYIEDIEDAGSVEEIMKVKQDLLVELVDKLPLFNAVCYFCLLQSRLGLMNCEKCMYGKIHGICMNKNSDYGKIIDMKDRFIDVISSLYYKGEKYKKYKDVI